ncbi:lysophospholipid acyltransferase family protein [Dyadobacter tibetensis]|uniref:lysophospholipid acyltransferase family protein n=1 Tax=Dyadobacter tibetensis TaxID=1211851 RepID=UPI000471888B|nr:lysophospholipid acyltransferase family protein [Dyadobacter tibetensis]
MKSLFVKILLITLNNIGNTSWKSIYRFSDVISSALYKIFRYRRDTVFTNLRKSLPQYNDNQLNRVAEQFYRNMTDIILESLKLQHITREELLERVSMDTSIFDQYYKQKKNLVVVLGHLGNWELANLYASVRLSHQVVVVYHQLANASLDRWMYNIRTRFGSELVPMNQALQLATAPRNKPFLFFLVNDQSPNPARAYWTKFLNQETGVFRGVEIISRALNAPVFYAAIMRQPEKRGHYQIKIEEITEHPNNEPLNAILEKQIKLLERDIILQPANWLWSHKRWKHSKPHQLYPYQQLESIE